MSLRLTVTVSEGLYAVKVMVPTKKVGEWALCDIRSQMVRNYFGTDDDRALAYFLEEAGRLERVVRDNQAFLLGQVGLEAYLETQGDRDEAEQARRRGNG